MSSDRDTLPGQSLSKWADKAMWTAEPSEAEKGTRAVLVSCSPDPLGEIWALNQTYIGKTVTDLSTVTDEQRRSILADIKSTVLKMPLEVIHLHFHISGIHRGITHQMVRQRTAAYAQESMRFAVKEDMKEAIALPPSLNDTLSLTALVEKDLANLIAIGLHTPVDEAERIAHRADVRLDALDKGGPQAWRIRWDEAVEVMGEAYLANINDGMPAEDARGLVPTNVLTKLHYITNLRSFYDTMGLRSSDQAQFEWRNVIRAFVEAMREYGEKHTYLSPVETGVLYDPAKGDRVVFTSDDEHGVPTDVVSKSSAWQFRELTYAILPIDFALGRRAFGSPFDRASRMGERIDAFATMGVPSSRWLQGAPEYNIPPLHPDEWLLDPNSARLKEGEEFDIFGQRVPAGQGWHWTKEHGGILYNDHGKKQWANLTDGPSFDINDVITKKEN